MNIQSVAVFCGSQKGRNPVFTAHAIELAKLIAILKLKCIYGGSDKGLMGAIASTILENAGHVMGIIPELLIEWEHQHDGLTELAVVPDMHSRKKLMYERCDAAIVLPGGFGTLDELFEMLTWNQLKIHDKKIYVLNSDGYYNHLKNHLGVMQKEGFLYEGFDERICFCDTPIEIFNRIG
ncbi:MAG: TIGR00730 family Rossman fold protein [Bacteroidetes bacterium]|nr:TIGR00730 family Rossman fold protein [Bacteroidota bacterium]MBS1974263.1 TIGR00730 family Rossman fold protein [Bacteroidota bacterium]